MSKQKCIKGLVTGMAAVMLFCGSSFTNAEASTEVISDNVIPVEIGGSGNLAEPTSTQYRWYYKKENGKTYRRLYDATHGKWITDWILCP